MHKVRFVAIALLLLASSAPALAQTDQRCFPETNQCISGRIREFWEQNGALPVFGFPIGPQHEETVEGKAFQVQAFERNRLELHPENQRPYDVLLGRLGVDRLQQQGRDWFTFPKGGEQPGCRHFTETGHTLCGAFLHYFQTHGLDLSQQGTSEAESLALFGLPLSEAADEVSPTDGKTYLTQHFERARFELHPENQPPFDVLLGLLGNEIRDNGGAPPPPPPPPPPPGPAPVPPPQAPCDQQAPAPTEGAQAWMTVPNPGRRSDETLCVRLIVGGQVVPGATASGTAHYKSTVTTLGPGTTGGDGVAAITFNTGGASSGFTVVVDATVSANGKTYSAQTSFTPSY